MSSADILLLLLIRRHTAPTDHASPCRLYLTQPHVFPLFLCVSLSLSPHASLALSLYIYLSLFLSLQICFCLYLSWPSSFSISSHKPPLSPYLCLSVTLIICMSVSVSLPLSLRLSPSLSYYHSVFLSEPTPPARKYSLRIYRDPYPAHTCMSASIPTITEMYQQQQQL